MKYLVLVLMSFVLVNCNKGVDGTVEPLDLSSNLIDINSKMLRFSNAMTIADPSLDLESDKMALHENDPTFVSMSASLAKCVFEQVDSGVVDGKSSYISSVDGDECPIYMHSKYDRSAVNEVTTTEGVINFSISDNDMQRESGLISLDGKSSSIDTSGEGTYSGSSTDVMDLTLTNDNPLRITKNKTYSYSFSPNADGIIETSSDIVITTLIMEQAGLVMVGKITQRTVGSQSTSFIFNIDGENVRKSTFDQYFEAWYHLSDYNN
ncbi:hypothetical protein N9W41_00945 [bacterium]|nr:hypothetical protein [bacterium]